ncbi:MAG: Ger(x)C family spore germination protein [Clostridia bacterium]|nr:Ger(x)C family spore germination protein [Clostridia bacterium]
MPVRTARAAVALALVACLLTGCWDSRDPKSQDIAIGLGFDVAPDGKTLVALAQIATASFLAQTSTGPGGQGGSSGGAQFVLAQGRGTNLPLALQDMDLAVGKNLFWGQVRIFFIGSALARQGVGSIVDQLVRHPFLLSSVDIVMIDGPLQPALQAPPIDSNISSIFVLNQLQSIGRNTVFPVATWSFFVAEHTPGWAPVMPVFRLEKQPGGSVLRPVGLAVFRRNRLATKLLGTEAVGYLALKNELRQTALGIPTPEGTAGLGNVSVKTAFRVSRWENGLPVFAVNVIVEGEIQSAPGGKARLTVGDVRRLADLTSETVRGYMASSLETLQRAGVDAVGFGAWLYYHDPAAFRRLSPWDATFRDLRFEIRVHTNLRYRGWRT